ncbi:MAG: hypothetical protein NZ744_03915 [Pirellulaceae bacterium]|nr:hypothetical protein [Pirellulaceae bacterium]MEE2766734.1 hypothetical protein [Pseudomonadota bacterium]
MSISFSNPVEVFIFIILCSVYVCSILWIYGDSATRDVGVKGAILPLVFVVAGALALAKGMMLALLVWPVGFIAWFIVRPKRSHVIVE